MTELKYTSFHCGQPAAAFLLPKVKSSGFILLCT